MFRLGAFACEISATDVNQNVHLNVDAASSDR
jgi:hypothetical protein